MASACVKNIGISSDTLFDSTPKKLPSYGWVSPRKSFSRGEYPEQKKPPAEKSEEADREDDTQDLGDFEFLLDNNLTMLTADELFLDGKLMPLQFSTLKATERSIKVNEISVMDPYLFSPKAPRCTASWKELLGLRKLRQKENNKHSNSSANKSIKSLIYGSSKLSMSSSFDGSVNQPLLKHSNNEYMSLSSRHESNNKSSSVTLPRVSVGKQQRGVRATTSSLENRTIRRQADVSVVARGIMDSPRMNASGKIVYGSLERSTSSPSSYGGQRYRHSSVQRSYSANVSVTPVLNVPVCSLRGSTSRSAGVLGLFGSSAAQPKRDSFGSISGLTCSKGSIRKDRN